MAEVDDSLRIVSKKDLKELTASDVRAVGSVDQRNDVDFDTLEFNTVAQVHISPEADKSALHTPRYEFYGSTTTDWYEVETYGVANRAVQIAHAVYTHARQSFVRYKHDNTWSSWKRIGDFVADGSVPMSGELYINNSLAHLKGISSEFSLSSLPNPLDWSSSRSLFLRNSSNANGDIKYALALSENINGVQQTPYLLYGEHNKPFYNGNNDCYYVGNGSGTQRTIPTGGVGSACLVYADGVGVALITPQGTFCLKDENLSALTWGHARIENGNIIIATTSDFVNKNGYTYSYQVL